jgi:transketolase
MRNEFVQALLNNLKKYENQIFITGDLGFMALEKLQKAFGNKFVNGGISEQNIISVAASLAYQGFIPWVYSISPFITLRPYEQIRNEVCQHNNPVKIVGNGGGYGYGIMGSTHHNLEDIGIMRILPNMRVYVPCFNEDLEICIEEILKEKNPNYLRLNNTKLDGVISYLPFSQWRKLKNGNKLIVVTTGPVVSNLFDLPNSILSEIEIWTLSIFPFYDLPTELVMSIKNGKGVVTMEEHSNQCSLNESLAALLLKNKIFPLNYSSLSAEGYPSGKYGDQKFHQSENSLSGDRLLFEIKQKIDNA